MTGLMATVLRHKRRCAVFMFFEKHAGVRRNSSRDASCESVDENQTRNRCSTRRCTHPLLPLSLRPSSVVRPKTSTNIGSLFRKDAILIGALSIKEYCKGCGSDDSFS